MAIRMIIGEKTYALIPIPRIIGTTGFPAETQLVIRAFIVISDPVDSMREFVNMEEGTTLACFQLRKKLRERMTGQHDHSLESLPR